MAAVTGVAEAETMMVEVGVARTLNPNQHHKSPWLLRRHKRA